MGRNHPARTRGFRLELREEARDWQSFGDRFHALEDNIEKVVRGKHDQIRLALVGLVAEGHLLIEDVPGVGKTMLAKALARSIDCSFRRIQFTPDMLPTDITGVNVFNQERGDFEFRPGAVFANVVLGDEINRASPKTQSALAGVHGGAAGHDRRGDPHARHALHRRGDAEPRRARGHLSPPRGAARPIHDASVGRLSHRRDRGRDPREPQRRANRSRRSGPSAMRWPSRSSSGWRNRSTSRRPSAPTS